LFLNIVEEFKYNGVKNQLNRNQIQEMLFLRV